MAILKIKDQEGNIIDIPAIRGDKGTDGYTPQKGVDYFTPEDITELNIPSVDQTYSPESENAQSGKAVAEAVSDKQDSLVSGTNIKTINNQSILGSGNITIEGGSDVEVDQNYNPESENAQSGKAVSEAVATEQKRADNTFANALKASKSDTAILLDDISPVTHEMSVKISSDTVEDLTAVKVSRCGKNLMQTNIIEVTSPASVENLIWRGNISGKLSFSLDNSEYTPNSSSVNSANFEFVFGDGTAKYLAAHASHIHLNTSSPLKEIYFLNWGRGTGVIKNIQLEIGSPETDYEPYVEPTEYTPNADGTVNGVTSLYPNTTLMTDTEGVLIDCEYNRDINKAFAALEAAIATNNS